MDVFLVPVGAQRYELYTEVPDDPEEPDAEPSGGYIRRHIRGLINRFRTMIAEAERERRLGRPVGEPPGWASRVKARTLRWVVESIAEQRLLWHLRRQASATFHYPADIDESTAVSVRSTQLKRDFEKHRFWLVIDTIGFIASGALMLIPGPNVLAYYFAFRMVGHFFSLRGARNGLQGVHWNNVASAPLAELRQCLHLDVDACEQRANEIARRLQLEHLASFFKRAAEPSGVRTDDQRRRAS